MNVLNRTVFITALFVATTMYASSPAPDRDQRRFEVDFMTMMIDHHFGGVKLAELCEDRTIHSELQELCETVISEQTAEIQQLQGWLSDWYGISKEPELDRKTRRQIEELSKLTGEEFEKKFMLVLIRHHAMAIESGLKCLLRAYHAELLDACAMTVGSQGEEIAMMRIWLCQWYSICDLDKRRDKHHHND